MPVSFSVAPHPAKAVQLDSKVQAGLTSEEIFAGAAKDQHQTAANVLQFGLAGIEGSYVA
jgi:hypothetical protein